MKSFPLDPAWCELVAQDMADQLGISRKDALELLRGVRPGPNIQAKERSTSR